MLNPVRSEPAATSTPAADAKSQLIDAVARRLRSGALTKGALARRMRTSRSAVNRLLDPRCETSLPTLVAAAAAIDMRLRLVLEQAPRISRRGDVDGGDA